MKSSWKKLRDLANHKVKERTAASYAEVPHDLEEVTKCMQNVQKIRKYYDRLHMVSSSIAMRSHGFSEAVQGLGRLFANTYDHIDDGEIGNIFRMVGKVQLEVAKLFDNYAKHVSELIRIPVENLMNELQAVEEVKTKYSEKRAFHDNLSLRITKGRLKTGKSDIYAEHQLKIARQQYEELAKSFGSGLLSLEQRHRHILISKVCCHHTVQLHLYRKAFASLNKIEPYLNLVAQEGNIDRRLQFQESPGNESENDNETNNHLISYADEHEEFASVGSFDQTRFEEKGTEIISLTPQSNHESDKSGSTSPLRLPQLEGAIVLQERVAEKQHKATKTFSSFTNKPALPSKTLSPTITNTSTLPHDVKAASPHCSTPQKSPLKKDHSSKVSSECHPQHHASSTFTHNNIILPETKAHSFSNVDADKASTPVRPFPILFRANGLDYAQPMDYDQPLQHSFSSSSPQVFNRPHSLSGPLTFMGNPWHGRRSLPKYSPWSSQPPTYPQLGSMFKSGPIGQACSGQSYLSPRMSPILASPGVCELHKLPPPPTDDTSDRYGCVISESRRMSVNSQTSHDFPNVSPLPLPPSDHTMHLASPYLADRTGCKPQHSKSLRYVEYPQVVDPDDGEVPPSPPLLPLTFKAGNTGSMHGLREYS